MSSLPITTERLILGPHTAEDAAALFAYRSDPATAAHLSWVPSSVEDAVHRLEELSRVALDTPDTWYQVAIRERGSGALVGDLGLHFLADPPRQMEIGYTLSPEHRRKGYATEAVRAAIGFCFEALGKHRIHASVDPRNTASMALLERLGLRKEGHFRQSLWWKGEWVDNVIYAMLASEWQEKKRRK